MLTQDARSDRLKVTCLAYGVSFRFPGSNSVKTNSVKADSLTATGAPGEEQAEQTNRACVREMMVKNVCEEGVREGWEWMEL